MPKTGAHPADHALDGHVCGVPGRAGRRRFLAGAASVLAAPYMAHPAFAAADARVNLAGVAQVFTSFHAPDSTLDALRDGIMPADSRDQSAGITAPVKRPAGTGCSKHGAGLLDWQVWSAGAVPALPPVAQAGIDRSVIVGGATYGGPCVYYLAARTEVEPV